MFDEVETGLSMLDDGFKKIGEAIADLGKTMWMLHFNHVDSALLDVLFGTPRLRKRARKLRASARRAHNRARRLEYRAAQRRAIGIWDAG